MSIDEASQERLCEWIGHLALEGEVADLLYTRFSGLRRGTVIEAHQDAALIGICAWRQDEGFAFLGPVAVHRDKRSWGLGSTLVGRAVDEIRSEGARSIESVYLSAHAASLRLFSKQRFRIIGSEEGEGDVVWTRVERHLKKS